MPNFDFECCDCAQRYEEMAPFDEAGVYPSVECPYCGSKQKERLMGAPAFAFGNPVNTDRWVSDTQGHDYRFHHNLPNVLKNRQYAEEHSHMGPNPYPKIDDISSGKYFGPAR